MALLLDILTWVCTTLYGGTLVTFALLFALYPRLSGRSASDVVRVFSAAGPIMGISMGGLFLGVFASRFYTTGLTPRWSTTAEQLDLAALILFGALWFSSFVLEIWTFHGIRPAREDAEDYDATFSAGYRNTALHLLANAALFLGWLGVRLATP